MSTPKFQRLSSYAFVYTPADADPHALIIFCPWLGSSQRHAAKYAALLAEIVPDTRILMLPSTLATMLSPARFARSALAPAVSLLQATLATGSGPNACPPRILLHVMSNGGALSLLQLLHARAAGSPPLPVQGLLLDSCPGTGTYGRSVHAIEAALPGPGAGWLWWWVLRWPARVLLRTMLLLMVVLRLGREDMLGRMRRELLDPKLLVGRGSSGVRVRYVYSMQDEVVAGEDVVAHAEQARRAGWHGACLAFC